MSIFIEIPTALEDARQADMGMKPERIPSVTKIDALEISAYSQCIPDDGDKDAIIVYLNGGHQFYSPIGMKEFERLLVKNHIG